MVAVGEARRLSWNKSDINQIFCGMNLFLPLKKKSLIHRFHLCHDWSPFCWIKLCNLLQQVQLLKNVMITALTQLFSSLWIETSKIHIFVHTLYIAECAMDLNFSFSPSPNKRTRQTTGLDRLSPTLPCVLGVDIKFQTLALSLIWILFRCKRCL